MVQATQRQKDELKAKIEQLMAAGCLFEAEKLYEKQPIFHVSIYDSLRARYVSKYDRELWVLIESILKEFDFIEADYVFAQNRDLLDYRKYQDLKTKYLSERLKVQLSNLLRQEKFAAANELYLSQKNLLTRVEYERIKTKYNQRMLAAVVPQLTSCFEKYDYPEAEKIYISNEAVFLDGFYETMKQTYVKKQLHEKLNELLRLRNFTEADDLHLSSSQLIGDVEYNKLRADYLHNYKLAVTKQLDKLLQKYDYTTAQEIVDIHQARLPDIKTYFEQTKAKYLTKQVLEIMEGLLCDKRFVESDQLYMKHKEIITIDAYENLKAKYTQKHLRLIEKT